MKSKAVLLEALTWIDAQAVLLPETVVVMALGAAAKEHGPHLFLNNDLVMAEYLKGRVLELADVVIAPTINCSYYPAFSAYAGSITLSANTAENIFVEICQSLAKFGPQRFYVINTGISTMVPLAAASKRLAGAGILMTYTNLKSVLANVPGLHREQEGGSHADELETSMMLYIDPARVDMNKAIKDYDCTDAKYLSPIKLEGTVYSPSGIWGDPTLATSEKGRQVVEFLVSQIVGDLETLKKTPLPPA